MALLTTAEAGSFLGIPEETEGLADAIAHAEAMVAGQLNLAQLDEDQHTEAYQMPTAAQQIVPRHGPIASIDSLTVNGQDVLARVTIDPSGWAVMWADFSVPRWYSRLHGFRAFADIDLTYTAGWSAETLPRQVREYVKAMVGLTLDNLLASGVYDTKLGDLTVKIQREVLQKNLAMYEPMLKAHRRPLI